MLIAMDVEQICRDDGAIDVVIARTLEEAEKAATALVDAAIVDVMLGMDSTLAFAAKLRNSGIPFVFASGYADTQEITAAFPDVIVVGKPYSGTDLVRALAAARDGG